MNKNFKNTLLNKPIRKETEDIIGLSAYVDRLNSAIDKDAQMIGVIAPFGSGKSSLIELLEEKRKEKEDLYYDEHFIKISMWNQKTKCSDEAKLIDFHKTFLYQLICQIDPNLGTYVSRRLSKNYGLFNLYFTNKRTKSVVNIMLLFAAIALCFGNLSMFFPILTPVAPNIKNITFIGSIILAIAIISDTPIVFSSNRSEGKRKIESDEIMDIYRTLVLETKPSFWHKELHLTKKNKKKRYIVVVDDLDRSANLDTAMSFLKEIKKYYIPDSMQSNYINKVIFIISVKPETMMKSNQYTINSKDKKNALNKNQQDAFGKRFNNESLYAKIFDYTVNLQTINVDNYDSILSGLLDNIKDDLISNNLCSKNDSPMNITGMQWIIREPKLGVREIKERLNIALTLYESLTDKFEGSSANTYKIEFEKCAVSAYLTTAFEEDFYKTDDRAFQFLIDNYLKCGKTVDSPDLAQYREEYRKVLVELVNAKLIDSSYRTYFYNFPKNSYLYSVDEKKINRVILYGDTVPQDIEKIAQQVTKAGSNIISSTLKKLESLKLPLPDVVFFSETIHNIALSICEEKIYEYWENYQYYEKPINETIDYIINFLTNLSKLEENEITKLCQCWRLKFKPEDILILRGIICDKFKEQIQNFRYLFHAGTPLITDEEISTLSFFNVFELVNMSHPDFSEFTVDSVLNKFESAIANEKNTAKLKEFLQTALLILDENLMAPRLLKFLILAEQVDETFESIIVNSITENTGGESDAPIESAEAVTV